MSPQGRVVQTAHCSDASPACTVLSDLFQLEALSMSKRSFRRCSDPGIQRSSAAGIPGNCASSCRLVCPTARVCDAQIAREPVNVTSLIQIDVVQPQMPCCGTSGLQNPCRRNRLC